MATRITKLTTQAVTAIGLFGLCLVSAHAAPILISTGSPTGMVTWTGGTSASPTTGLSSSMLVTLNALTQTSATLSFTLTNNSTSPINSAFISDVGFNIGTPVSAATATLTGGSAFAGNAALGATINGSGNNKVDVCYSANSGCQGPGAAPSVAMGQTATWTSVLTFTTPLTPAQLTNFQLSLSNFSLKYQGVSTAGYTVSTNYSVENYTGAPVSGVPEAATFPTLGAGLVAAGLLGRKIRRQ